MYCRASRRHPRELGALLCEGHKNSWPTRGTPGFFLLYRDRASGIRPAQARSSQPDLVLAQACCPVLVTR